MLTIWLPLKKVPTRLGKRNIEERRMGGKTLKMIKKKNYFTEQLKGGTKEKWKLTNVFIS